MLLLFLLLLLFHVLQEASSQSTHVWENYPHTTQVVISDEHKVVYVDNSISKLRIAIEKILHTDRSDNSCCTADVSRVERKKRGCRKNVIDQKSYSTTGCLNATHDDYFFFSFVQHPVKKFERGARKAQMYDETLRSLTGDEMLERQLDRLKRSGSDDGGLLPWASNRPWVNKHFQSNAYSLTGLTTSNGPVRLDFVGCVEDFHADLARAADLYDESTASSTPCAAAYAGTTDPPQCGLRLLFKHLLKTSKHHPDNEVDAALLSDNGIARLCASEEFNAARSLGSSAPLALASALNRYNCTIPKGSQRRIESLSAPKIESLFTATAASEAEETPSSKCCYHPKFDLTERFNKTYFAYQRTNFSFVEWKGSEYEEWKQISSTTVVGSSCQAEWNRVLLQEAEGKHLRELMDYLHGAEDNTGKYKYVEERPNSPRVLFLGDSVSLHTAEKFYRTFHETANATLVKSPANCGSFSRYYEKLDGWLGDCPWDVIQFNVGLHFHPQGVRKSEVVSKSEVVRREYEGGLERVVHMLRAHSPDASLVFALTTPSPFDSSKTTPDRESCPHYDKFHPAGFVPFLNSVARGFLPTLNVTINDRYGAVQPALKLYQKPCDVHYERKGYERLVDQDWEVVSRLLVDPL